MKKKMREKGMDDSDDAVQAVVARLGKDFEISGKIFIRRTTGEQTQLGRYQIQLILSWSWDVLIPPYTGVEPERAFVGYNNPF